MPKFRKKPVVIEAVQFLDTSETMLEIIEWTKGSPTPAHISNVTRNHSARYPEGFDYPLLVIATLEGEHIVSKDDFVIKGVAGEFYPCKPDIFEKTYEPVK